MSKGFAFKTHEIRDFYSMRHMKESKKICCFSLKEKQCQ